MKTAVLCLGLAAMLAVLGDVMADCDGSHYVDGCSTPNDIAFPYKKKFKPACNRHDVCYQCGAAKGHSQAACDNAFLKNMAAICSWWDLPCYITSLIYYAAVRVAGTSYKSTAMTYCSKSWVGPCLP